MPRFDVDLFVIGGGSGGVRAARIASGYGARVLLAEEYRMGGTCVIRGCVPKKLMVIASRFADDFAEAVSFGWSASPANFDWATLKGNMTNEIARLEQAYRTTLIAAGVEIIDSRAVIEGPHSVRILRTGDIVTAKYILVATGAYPAMEAIPGGEYATTSNEIFDMEELPKRILVVGGGYIAVEFAGIFSGLGSEVTLVHRGDRLLRGFDDEIRERLGMAYVDRDIELRFGTTIERLERRGKTVLATLSKGQVVTADQILVATGRRPNTANLGLEAVGVALESTGAIVVDAYSRTRCSSIFAVGDVTNRANLTPVAIREGHAFAENTFADGRTVIDYELIPTAVFSTPEIGVIGLGEAEARARIENIVIYKSSFRPMRSSISGSNERVFMKLVVDGDSDRVLGAHILGPDAGEMIQLAGVAITMGATKADFDRTVAVHPTVAEELVTMRAPIIAKTSLVE